MSNTEVQEASDLRVYEVGFHLIPKVAEAEMPAEVEKIKSILSAHGASVIAEETPRMTQLSYPMSRAEAGKRDRYNQAWFGWVKFEVEPSQVKEIESEVSRMPLVLRMIVISTVRESTRSAKIFVSDRPLSETIRKPEKAPAEPKKLSEAEIETAVDELVAGAEAATPGEKAAEFEPKA